MPKCWSYLAKLPKLLLIFILNLVCLTHLIIAWWYWAKLPKLPLNLKIVEADWHKEFGSYTAIYRQATKLPHKIKPDNPSYHQFWKLFMLTYIMNSSCHINPRYQGTTQNQNKTSVWLPIFYCIKPSFPRYHWFFFWSWFVLGNLFFSQIENNFRTATEFCHNVKLPLKFNIRN